jgi:hypothetical protein
VANVKRLVVEEGKTLFEKVCGDDEKRVLEIVG